MTSGPLGSIVNTRTIIHIGFAVIIWLIILAFDKLNQQAIINTILLLAGYTYGPLLALFAAGLFTKISFNDNRIPIACIIGPILCYALKTITSQNPDSYQIGNELILVNGLLTFTCLILFSKKRAL